MSLPPKLTGTFCPLLINTKVSCLITQIIHTDCLTHFVGKSRSSVCCFTAECRGGHSSPNHAMVLYPYTGLESSYVSLSHMHEARVYRMNNLDPGFQLHLISKRERAESKKKKKEKKIAPSGCFHLLTK